MSVPEGLLTQADPLDTPPTEVVETPTPGTPAGDAPDPPKPDDKVTPDVQKRIDQLTREKHTASREAERLKAELDAVKRKADAGPRPEPPDLTTLTNAEGQLDPVKYKKAIAEHEDKLHAWREAQKGPAAPTVEAEPAPSTQAPPPPFLDGIKAIGAEHADVYEVINRPVFTPEMRDALWESEQGPQLAYYLGTHQAEAMRLGELPARQMLRELGKLEAKLGAAPAAPSPRTVSGAPEPIEPVRGATATTKDPEKMSTEEFMAWDRARTTERLKGNPLGV